MVNSNETSADQRSFDHTAATDPPPEDPRASSMVAEGPAQRGGSGARAPAGESSARVLCVDDESNVLRAIARILGRDHQLTLASSPVEALAIVERDPSFAVVISDLRMPTLDGVRMLERLRELAPDIVAILFTGALDVRAAVDAVNDAQVFRFLTKPCQPTVLQETVAAAVERYRAVAAERALVEQTSRNGVRVLVDALSRARPEVLGPAARIVSLAGEIAERVAPEERWQVEVAAQFTQIGHATLPAETFEKLNAGSALAPDERQQVLRAARLPGEILASLPRLEAVDAILRFRSRRFDADDDPGSIPIGARILRAVVDLDTLQGQGTTPADALASMDAQDGLYDPRVLDALRVALDVPRPEERVTEVSLLHVQLGMIFADEVRTERGVLVASGQEVTPAVLQRIRHHLWSYSGARRVRVIVPDGEAATAAGMR